MLWYYVNAGPISNLDKVPHGTSCLNHSKRGGFRSPSSLAEHALSEEVKTKCLPELPLGWLTPPTKGCASTVIIMDVLSSTAAITASSPLLVAAVLVSSFEGQFFKNFRRKIVLSDFVLCDLLCSLCSFYLKKEYGLVNHIKIIRTDRGSKIQAAICHC